MSVPIAPSTMPAWRRGFGHRLAQGVHQLGGQGLWWSAHGLVGQPDVLDGAGRARDDCHGAVGRGGDRFQLGQLLLHLADVGELLVNALHLGLEPLELSDQLLERRRRHETSFENTARARSHERAS
jgi:hypothetical protein